MEIERKFLVRSIPADLESYPLRRIEQGYLCTEPVVRIRKDNDAYMLTYKSKGLLSREEYNLPLTRDAYTHLKTKADGRIISKKRYCIPYLGKFTIELDIFEDELEGLILAEVEFSSEEEALAFLPPEWFGMDVTMSPEYQNSSLSQRGTTA